MTEATTITAPGVLPAEDLHHAVLQRGQQREIVGVAHVGIHVDGKASVRVQLPDDAHPVGIGIVILNAHAVQRPETGGAEQRQNQQRGPKHPLTELPPVHQKQRTPAASAASPPAIRSHAAACRSGSTITPI